MADKKTNEMETAEWKAKVQAEAAGKMVTGLAGAANETKKKKPGKNKNK